MAIKKKHREWVKWAAIVFLSVLLVLTFFSNTIRNRNLVQVSTVRVTSGTITPVISGGGQVESAGLMPVLAEYPGTVTAILVQPGDVVTKGQALLEAQLQDDGSLDAMKQQLEALESEYEIALLQASVTTGSSDTAELQRLKNNLAAAENQLTARKEYDSQRSVLESKVREAESALDNAKTEYGTNVGPVEVAQLSAEQALADSELALANAQANEEYLSEKYAKDETEENKTAWDAALQILRDAEETVMTRKNELFAAQQAYNTLSREYQPAVTQAEENLQIAQSELAEFERNHAGLPDLLTCENAVLSCKAAISDFYDRQSAGSVNQEIQERNLAALEEKIQNLQTEIADKEASLGARTIDAPCAGTLTDFYWNLNDSFAQNQQMAVIDSQAESYTLRFPVSLENARMVQPGTSAAITNQERILAEAFVNGVAPNENAPAELRDLVFMVRGEDVTAGMYLSLSVNLSSTRYPLVVPNAAIYRDSMGLYVYAVDSTSSALGSRTILRRVAVTAIDSDDRYTAIQGSLNDSDYVVTLASGPLSDGQSVRLGN